MWYQTMFLIRNTVSVRSVTFRCSARKLKNCIDRVVIRISSTFHDVVNVKPRSRGCP